jgi:hypothetical protein
LPQQTRRGAAQGTCHEDPDDPNEAQPAWLQLQLDHRIQEDVVHGLAGVPAGALGRGPDVKVLHGIKRLRASGARLTIQDGHRHLLDVPRCPVGGGLKVRNSGGDGALFKLPRRRFTSA